MSLRISLVMVIIASFAGIAVTWFVKNPPIGSAKEEDLPFFYTLSPDDIRKIRIKTTSGEEAFTATFEGDPERRQSIWYFDDPAGIPVNFDRWGGITFLLGGPKTQRVLKQSFDNPADYGLDRPSAEISMTLRDGSSRTLRLGRPTPDGGAHYAQMEGYEQLVLVDSSWGDVLARLVNEPPLPQWYYTFDIAKAHEVLFYLNNDVVRGVGYDDEKEQWFDCKLPIEGNPCVGDKQVDKDRFTEGWLNLLASPKFTAVEKVARTIEEAKHEAYGLDLDAPYITVRIETVNPRGITEVTMTTLTLGDLTPAGTEMYVLANEQPTVARVEAEWGNQVKALFESVLVLAPGT
ncbi:MAG: DUF4340 domain-containing protein [Chloroflexi bacterium]|nr:DUF4340 domain-containing protein [Chloroflexota bacterium]